jgi:Ser/Thr protein kinase RdoA (MazF antagonist)
MLNDILKKYGFTPSSVVTTIFGNGLINNTWMVDTGTNKFILQRINDNIFKKPTEISANIRMIGNYLSANYPAYVFVNAVQTLQQEDIAYLPEHGYFRLFPFVKSSHTIDVVSTPSQAYEAAKQFGLFAKVLSAFPTAELNITLPDFHNLPLRYQQFETAILTGNKERLKTATESIQFLNQHREIVAISESIPNNLAFKKRVTHHDTKISNVLFNDMNEGICVIDLDTLMPGYFISDVGDMIRTYLSPVSEEEKDFSKIELREDYFKAIADGYLSEMNNELSDTEKKHFVYAGKFMIYMQALRFLTDYLNDDIYYGSKYEGQNFIRANNQIELLKKLIEKEDRLQELFEDKSLKKMKAKN